MRTLLHLSDLHFGRIEESVIEPLVQCVAQLKPDLVVHVSHAGSTAARYKFKGHTALVVQAGTATSTRAKGESNSFNAVRIDGSRTKVGRLIWMPEQTRFSVASTQSFEFLLGGWVPP